MPIQDGQGYGTQTHDKQQGLEMLLCLHMEICRHIFAKRGYGEYLYVDTHAGSGQNPETIGSPLVFKNAQAKSRIPYHAYYIEKKPRNTAALKQRMIWSKKDEIITGDSASEIGAVLKGREQRLGLIYIDPNGVPDWNLLATAARLAPRMDILIRLNAAALKRVRLCGRLDNEISLDKIVNRGLKKLWILREPIQGDTAQWSFALGTNYTAFRQWSKQRFHRIDTRDGQRIYNLLNYSREEIQEMQLPVWKPPQISKIETWDIFSDSNEKEVHNETDSPDLDLDVSDIL